MKMYFTMSNIISILNERETDELYKLTMKSIDKDIIFNDDYEIYERINNLEMNNESLTNRIRMLEEDFERLKKSQLDKYFEYSDNEDSENSDYCGCGKEPNKQCEEIEEYLKNIKMVD